MAKSCNCNKKPTIGGIDDVIANLPLQTIGGSVAGLIAARFVKNQLLKMGGEDSAIDPKFKAILVGTATVISGGYVMSQGQEELQVGFGLGWATEGIAQILEASGVPTLQGIASGNLIAPTSNTLGRMAYIPKAQSYVPDL